jgi:[ribosomal protein S5]-alanine N-acetyltransferase
MAIGSAGTGLERYNKTRKYAGEKTGVLRYFGKTIRRIQLSFQITTERLVLEDMTDQDLVGIRRIARDPRVMRYVLIWLENDEQVARFLQHAIDESRNAGRLDYVLAARIPATGDFAGFVMLEIDPEQPGTAEVGCILLPDYWKTGYASEILRALLHFGFTDLSLHRVFGKCDEGNSASAHVLEKCGLQYEGTLREHVWLRDHWRSTRYYGMLEGEYSPRG